MVSLRNSCNTWLVLEDCGERSLPCGSSYCGGIVGRNAVARHFFREYTTYFCVIAPESRAILPKRKSIILDCVQRLKAGFRNCGRKDTCNPTFEQVRYRLLLALFPVVNTKPISMKVLIRSSFILKSHRVIRKKRGDSRMTTFMHGLPRQVFAFHRESLAWSKGTTIADWAREALLHNLGAQGLAAMEMHIFTELVGLQMLLMKTLEPLLRGDKMAQDQLNILFRQVQTTKAAQAQELLAKRSQNREK